MHKSHGFVMSLWLRRPNGLELPAPPEDHQGRLTGRPGWRARLVLLYRTFPAERAGLTTGESYLVQIEMIPYFLREVRTED